MIYTTSEYWEVDGQSLQTYAFNISSWGGDRQAPPPLRGSNTIIPNVAGQTYEDKVPDSRTMTLQMWVTGAEEDGSVPTSGAAADQFRENWAMLRRLLWTPYREITITKRIKHPVSQLWVPVSAKAQFAGGLQPTMMGPSGALFSVDIFLADPFFYGDPETINFTPTSSTQEFDALGDARTTDITLTFSDLINPKLTDSDKGIWMQYAATVASGESVEIDVNAFKATHFLTDGTSYKAAGNVQQSLGYHWLYVEPGPTKIILSSDGGSGSAVLTYLPSWL